ncbi:uncharacterized protein B4U80_06652 [Leptotrombidium deliense]|uniref:Major facilitator superfamily (MFS) profile domain-containing protein n=1 Tax=Leptotrombidium deliense TaxID=299467 RepID=A0A443SQW9_9ACAR|nr:uncharacterized protein B4U80_06652 [Leptotrombidium deliense]
MESANKREDETGDKSGNSCLLLSVESTETNINKSALTDGHSKWTNNGKNECTSKYKASEVNFAINYLDGIQVHSQASDAFLCTNVCETQIQRPNSAETRVATDVRARTCVSRNVSVESAPSSNTNKRSNKNIHRNCKFTPPDGGWGWVIVFASFMISVIADGISFTFGILFVDLTEYFKAGKSKTALVGSLFFSIPLLIGPLASALTDHFGCRKVTIISGIVSAFGFVIGYFSTSLEHLFIAFSISGIGLSLSYVTSIVIVAYYFEKRRSLATGLAVCGTGIGTFIFPPLTIFLLKEYTWRGTLLIMAGFFLNIVVFGAFMRDLDLEEDTTESSCDFESDTPSTSNDTNTQALNCNANVSDKVTINETHKYSSLIAIPTYIAHTNSCNVLNEVLSEISSRKGGHLWQLMQRYPNLISNFLSKEDKREQVISLPPQTISSHNETLECKSHTKEEDRTAKSTLLPSPNKRQSNANTVGNRLPSANGVEYGAYYLRNMKLQRGSITYRSAMLNIKRYRLRASSAPDIYRNSMVTINTTEHLNNFMHDVKDILMDIVDLRIFKSFKYTLFCISNLLLYACIDIPYVYIPDHAITTGSSDKDASSLFISVIGVVIVGYFGDKPWIEAPKLYSILISLGGVSITFIPLVHSYKSLAILAAIYGFAISANYSLVSVILVDIISLDKFTNGYGLLLLVQGIASLFGPPIAGWLYDLTGNYNFTFYTSGVCILVSGIIVIPVANNDRCCSHQDYEIKTSHSLDDINSQKDKMLP